VSGNAELVRAWHRAAERGRVEEMVALTHPEFAMTEASALPGAVHVVGIEALRSYGYGWTKNWSRWEWREEDLIELPPDRLVFVATLRLRGLRSTIWVEHRWAYLIEIRDGLIVRDDGFLTAEEALASAGAASLDHGGNFAPRCGLIRKPRGIRPRSFGDIVSDERST
jgi:ketosteroid isomerase-like protein